MKFLFLKGTLKGKKIETDQSVITIGSDKSNLLVIEDPGISSRHAYIEKLDDQWMLIDAKSTNGVYINGEKVEHKSNLTDYDTIKLAEVEFVVLMSSEATAPVLKKPVVTFAAGKKQPAEAVEITQEYSSNDKVLRETKGQKNKAFSKTISLIAFIVVVLIACFVGRKGLNHTSMAVNTEIVQAETSQEVAAPKVDVKKTPEREVKKKNKTVVVSVSEESQEVEIAAKPEKIVAAPKVDVKKTPEREVKKKNKTVVVSVSEEAQEVEIEVKPEKVVAAKPKPLNGDVLYDFTKKNCFRCHNEKKQKGRIRIDDNDFLISDNTSVERWQDILDILNVGSMPPEDEDQPSGEELSAAIRVLTSRLLKAKEKHASTGGSITMRHLNRQDYQGSIFDLFGARLDLAGIPLDSQVGLSTDGREQFFSINHKVQYFTTATRLIRSAIVAIQEKKYKAAKKRYDPESFFLGRARQAAGKVDIEKYRSMTEKEMRAAIRKIYPDKQGRIIVPRAILYLLDENHKVGAGDRVMGNWNIIPGQKYKMSIVTFGNSAATTPLLFNGLSGPYPVNLRFDSSKKRHIASFNFTGPLLLKERASNKHKITFEVHPPKGGYVDYFLLEPIKSEKSYFENCFEQIIASKSVSDNELRKAFTNFCRRAFRNTKPAKGFIESLTKQARSNLKNGARPRDAIVMPLATVLSSASFLYIKEYSNGLRQEMPAEDHANRLAYFIMGAPANDKLMQAAREGELKSKKRLAQHLNEMLKSEKGHVALENFFAHWFELKRLNQTGLKGYHRDAVRKEPLKFFMHLVTNNLPIDNLIDSDFVVVNQYLAKRYGLKTKNQDFQPVKLPVNSKRGGVLTQIAFLAVRSPTVRGTRIRSKFLNDPPPPPPPDVPMLKHDHTKPKTHRELADRHKEIPQCRSCHEKIDPVGYGLENFDGTGVFRTGVQLRGRGTRLPGTRFRQPIKIDASGHLNKSQTFADLEGFKAQLLKNKDKLARSIFESMLATGMGRRIEYIDEKEIEACLKRLKKNNYRTRDLILEVINTKAFRSK